MLNKMILCEGPCSLPVSMSVVEELEADMVYSRNTDEKNMAVRSGITARLKLREHQFERSTVNALSGSTSFIFSCVSCGHERIYGKVRDINQEIRDLYGLAQ